MTGDQIAGVIRAVVAALGGYFVGQGVTDAETVATIGGAAATLGAAIWSNPSFSEFFSLSDEEIVQDVVNKAAEEYWEKAVDKAVSDELTPGDTLFYHGKGTPETNLNRKDEPQGHGGHNGVPLNNMRGTVIKYIDSVTGPRVLVKWDNWNDGHNGMGDDPEAKMGATNYWWSNVNNVSKVN